jgi:hypothetical protein
MIRFSLKQLLMFISACCVYFTAVRSMFAVSDYDESGFGYAHAATTIGVWAIFALGYAHWAFRDSLIIHVLGPFAMGVVLLLQLLTFRLSPPMTILEVSIRAVILGCCVGTFISFPTTAWIILTSRVRTTSHPQHRPQGVHLGSGANHDV